MENKNISLLSKQGQKLLESADFREGFWALCMSFLTQETQTYCGVASSVMVMNALPILKPITAPYAPHSYFTQDNYFSKAVQEFVHPKKVRESGMTLDQLTQALLLWNCHAKATHAAAANLDEFREELRNGFSTADRYMIVNVSRAGLGQEGGGHFSPIGAYDSKTDRVLFMDVSRYKYPPFWFELEVMFDAMNTEDTSSRLTRGWCMVGV